VTHTLPSTANEVMEQMADAPSYSAVRATLRVLEQKVNANDKLSDADKFDMQQYITRCYGSLTTFNVLFKNKEDQFLTSG
jgi:hypothetical protein